MRLRVDHNSISAAANQVGSPLDKVEACLARLDQTDVDGTVHSCLHTGCGRPDAMQKTGTPLVSIPCGSAAKSNSLDPVNDPKKEHVRSELRPRQFTWF